MDASPQCFLTYQSKMLRRLLWMWSTDRLGPDIPLTYVMLFSRRLGNWLCRKKFKSFGDGSQFRPQAYAVCTSRISVGRNVTVRPGCMFFAGEDDPGTIVIEDDVLIASGVHIYCDNHEFSDISRPISHQQYRTPRPVLIRKGAWIGAQAIILPGVTIGRNAVVGAGSVVVRSVPDFSVAVGNPARVIKMLDQAESRAGSKVST